MIELPYGDTGGFERGHATSEDRARREAESGVTGQRQSAVHATIRKAMFQGLTWKELGEEHGWHHGQASSALSNLHKRGLVARLEETRNRCGVYVAWDWVWGRETVTQGRRYDAATLARDVPLPVLLEALRIAQETP